MIKIYLSYKKQLNNFIYLSIVYGINILLPLILFPFLLSSLGKEIYGEVIYAQTVASYFLVFTNFGFNISSTKAISLHRENKERVNLIFSSTIYSKLLFFFLSLFILVLFGTFFNLKGDKLLLYALSLLICFSDALLPIWYFQAIEKMKYITVANLLSRLSGAICILIFVRDKSDYLLVPCLYFLGNFLGAIISLYIVFIKEKVCLTPLLISEISKRVKEGYLFLFSDFSAILKDKGNITIIGAFLGMSYVVYYDLAEKIVWAFRSILYNLNIAFFPYIVKIKNRIITKKIIWFAFICSLICYSLLCVFSNEIIYLLSRNTEMFFINSFIYIQGIYLLLATLSSCVGQFIMITHNLERYFFKSLLISSLSYFLFVFLLYIFNFFSIESLVLIYNGSIFVELIYRLYICRRKKLIQWVF